VELSARTPEEAGKKEEEILRLIVLRYANEIAGNFKPSSYRFASKCQVGKRRPAVSNIPVSVAERVSLKANLQGVTSVGSVGSFS